jgi:hypothetical protein
MMKSTFVGAAALALMPLIATPTLAEDINPEGPVLALREPEPVTTQGVRANALATMAGHWSGRGTIELTNDITEKLRCRANHTFRAANNGLSLSIRCASDNYKFELASDVVERRGQISGKWSEAAYKASGTITGRVAGNRVVAMAQSDTLTTNVSVTTNGNRQTIVITPEKTYVIKVQIALARR